MLPSRASTEPTAQFSYQLVVTVGGLVRSCYQPMTYQHSEEREDEDTLVSLLPSLLLVIIIIGYDKSIVL